MTVLEAYVKAVNDIYAHVGADDIVVSCTLVVMQIV